MNKVILSGEVNKDFDLKSTPKGLNVSTVTLKCFNDETKKSFLLIDCVFWGDKATSVSNIAKKGTFIELEGRISKSSYKQDGKTLYKTEVIVDRFETLNEVTNGIVKNQYNTYEKEEEYNSDPVLNFSDDELPF